MVTQPASTEETKDGKAQEKTEVQLNTFWACDMLIITIQVDEMVEKIYSNMSACHIKNGNWKRATEAAEKVCALHSNPTRC